MLYVVEELSLSGLLTNVVLILEQVRLLNLFADFDRSICLLFQLLIRLLSCAFQC